MRHMTTPNPALGFYVDMRVGAIPRLDGFTGELTNFGISEARRRTSARYGPDLARAAVLACGELGGDD